MDREEIPFYDPSYFTIEFAQASLNRSGDTRKINYTTYEVEQCSDRFYDKYGFTENVYCPVNPDYYLKGSIVSEVYEFFQATIVKCQGTHCQSNKTIEDKIEAGRFNIIVRNSYVSNTSSTYKLS
jgi:hypothetical protein